MSDFMEVTSDTFEGEVLQADVPVLVDFGAVWCAPCKRLDPLVKELAAEWGEKIKVVHVDVDHNSQITIDHQVMGVPSLLLFKDGQVVERTTGFKPKDKLVQAFEPHL